MVASFKVNKNNAKTVIGKLINKHIEKILNNPNILQKTDYFAADEKTNPFKDVKEAVKDILHGYQTSQQEIEAGQKAAMAQAK